MTKILFGTESGNSEMAADDIADFLNDNGGEAEVVAMEDYDVADLAAEGFAVVITSTYGEGELPETTQPFYDALKESRPDLSGLRFAAFGLGDSTYETYGNGIDIVAALLAELGAVQVGETGRHDAAKTVTLTDAATGWAEGLQPTLAA
ncbi:flavodoxin domain-containing protein [Poseidonocella sp. HB161398]|uniref:flavodoxin domain-containing protein n=1 Tax=Poseidonocella sp. HB161398 TaxID=2320855 RepID=UPI00110942F7|nr:flavodoxin domain-containing protein [Poseidonocella sp. HB161398]